jgi:hypothetical protein
LRLRYFSDTNSADTKSAKLVLKAMQTIQAFDKSEDVTEFTNLNRTLDFNELLSGYIDDNLQSIN